MPSVPERPSLRQTRLLAFIAEFTTELSADQALDTEFMRLRHSTSSTMNFQSLKSFDNNLIWWDVSAGHIRPYITAKFQNRFSRLHTD